jgi:hypothetical protein
LKKLVLEPVISDAFFIVMNIPEWSVLAFR